MNQDTVIFIVVATIAAGYWKIRNENIVEGNYYTDTGKKVVTIKTDYWGTYVIHRNAIAKKIDIGELIMSKPVVIGANHERIYVIKYYAKTSSLLLGWYTKADSTVTYEDMLTKNPNKKLTKTQ